MITHDSAFESLATAPVKQTDVTVIRQIQDPYGFIDDNTAEWTSSNYLTSVNIDAVGAFLGTTTKKATVKLIGIIEDVAAEDIFQVRLGLYNNDPSVEGFDYISQGFYVVDDVDYDYDSGTTTVNMYDHMWRAIKTEYGSGFTYPCTVEELAEQAAGAIGVDLMDSFSDLPNYDYVIAEDLYANIANATVQTVIQEIAAATGTTARISDTTLVFSQFSVSDEVLTSNELKKLKIGEKYGPVTSVILGRVPQNDNVVQVNTEPSNSTISSINSTTNLFTATGHGLTDGSLVQIQTTDTLPEPLEADTNYFVYTNSEADTFALTQTYEDAIAGTNIIDLTTDGSGTITLSNLPIQEVQINNVEILDDDRQDLLPPLYEQLVGIRWNGSKSDTVGLGWHEVGDVISYQQGSTVVPSFITELHLVLAGSVKEALVSTVPDTEVINYETAGGVIKTIYNTEIKVDKQANEITSVVSELATLEDTVAENYTEVLQEIDSVTTSIQNTGGVNIIKNSVGYATDSNGDIELWEYSGDGEVTPSTSPESLTYGAVSGNKVSITGTGTLTQRVIVEQGGIYSFAVKGKKEATGSVTVHLQNTTDDYTVTFDDSVSYLWNEQSLSGITASLGYFDVIVETDDPIDFSFTDLRLVAGENVLQWSQAAGEVMNTQVVLNTEGIRVNSSIYSGDFTQITPLEFAGYSAISGTRERVFSLNRDTTEVQKLEARGQISMEPIKIVPIKEGEFAGWAFVSMVS